MNVEECIKNNKKCKTIIVKSVEITSIAVIKKDGEWVLNPKQILDKQVKNSTSYGTDKLIIEYYMYR